MFALGKPFQPRLRSQEPTLVWSTWKMIYSDRLPPYSQAFDQSRKTCKAKHSSRLRTLLWYRHKKVFNIVPRCQFLQTGQEKDSKYFSIESEECDQVETRLPEASSETTEQYNHRTSAGSRSSRRRRRQQRRRRRRLWSCWCSNRNIQNQRSGVNVIKLFIVVTEGVCSWQAFPV